MNDFNHLGDPSSPRSNTRRFGTASLVATLVVGLALGVGGAAIVVRHSSGKTDGHDHGVGEAAKRKYQCPMHPSIVMDHPGDCPVCGMKLVPIGGAADGAGEAKSAAKGPRKVAFYRSPMDPKQTSPTPRKDEMGMDYLPVYEDEVTGDGSGKVEGVATVNIDPARQQLIGLHTTEAVLAPVGGSWETVGRVAVAEPRVYRINVKVGGYVEKIHVDYVGQPVKAGQPLFSVYSPELVSAQEEYLLAARTAKALGGEGRGAGKDLVDAARRRLKLWDIPESEIGRLEETGQPRKTLTLYSPVNGVVTKKNVVLGYRLQEGEMPYEITDLSKVWVLADGYESDLRRIRIGMNATISLEALPNRTFRGKVVFVDPVLDPKTRTAKVRLEFANPTGELRPDMFGEVTFQASTHNGLRIPSDAIIDSGRKSIVFVALGDGKFQPREVRLGVVNTDAVEVVSGLKVGEQVVTRATFLVDSESRLRASLAAMGGK